MKKKILVFTILSLFILTSFSFASQLYFSDKTGIISQQQAAYLNLISKDESEKSGMDIISLIVDDFEGKTPEEYANYYIKENYPKDGGEKDSVFLVINPDSRDYYVVFSGKAKKIFEGKNRKILKSSIIKELSKERYYDAVKNFILTSSDIAKNYGKFTIPAKALSLIFLFSLIIGNFVSYLLTKSLVNRQNFTVKKQKSADMYLQNNLSFTDAKDIFLYHTVNRTKRADDSDSGRFDGDFSKGDDKGFGGKF